jgi:hypothetical protein
MIYTIPWLPTSSLPHPWARAWGAGITEWATALAAPLARALAAPLGWVAGRRAAGAAAGGLVGRVEAATNLASVYLLDHTAWWVLAGFG